MLSADPHCELRGQLLQVATVYVTEASVAAAPGGGVGSRGEAGGGLAGAGGTRGLRLAFTFDALAGQWPYLVTRDLEVGPDARLEAILHSHFLDVAPEALDPMYSSDRLLRLLHLVINAILYATSAGVEPELRHPPARRPPGPAPHDHPVLCSDAVYYLPGEISISQVKRLQQLERAPGGGKLMHRFMVRGHWRRAPRSWGDQRPRWVKPYWKGPEIAAIIERAYRMKP
jgi:hypothetical protein